ncbi:MAG TPA: serine hydrolase, partial [Flavobacterium sp.]|nr:serine hydrolase [Flavobacterium sp.]
MATSKSFFNNLFKDNPAFDSVLSNKDSWNVQVIFTRIDRNHRNKPRLTTFIYNDNPQYFYPASTVKLPIALLSLQRLSELKKQGVDKNTTMLTEAAYSRQTAVYNDPNTPDGRPTVANYIRKIFLVSDNDAANRLYEFLGQEYINTELHKKGYSEAQILHRLAITLTEDENRHSNPIKFYDKGGKLIYSQKLKQNYETYSPRNDFSGQGYYSNGKLINAPMDFSKKNRIALASLHKMMTGIVFPEKVKRSERILL